MAAIGVGEIVLDCERSGAGPPLFLIMGMSGTALHWHERFLGPLRRDFEVIAYDHRGVGASSRLEGSLTIAQLAEDAAGLLDALELDSAHVLGISMGGVIAQRFALDFPARVRSLILVSTSSEVGAQSVAAWQRLADLITRRGDWAGHFSVVERGRVRMRLLG